MARRSPSELGLPVNGLLEWSDIAIPNPGSSQDGVVDTIVGPTRRRPRRDVAGRRGDGEVVDVESVSRRLRWTSLVHVWG